MLSEEPEASPGVLATADTVTATTHHTVAATSTLPIHPGDLLDYVMTAEATGDNVTLLSELVPRAVGMREMLRQPFYQIVAGQARLYERSAPLHTIDGAVVCLPESVHYDWRLGPEDRVQLRVDETQLASWPRTYGTVVTDLRLSAEAATVDDSDTPCRTCETDPRPDGDDCQILCQPAVPARLCYNHVPVEYWVDDDRRFEPVNALLGPQPDRATCADTIDSFLREFTVRAEDGGGPTLDDVAATWATFLGLDQSRRDWFRADCPSTVEIAWHGPDTQTHGHLADRQWVYPQRRALTQSGGRR